MSVKRKKKTQISNVQPVEKQDNADVKPQPEPAQVAPQKEVVTLDAKEVPQKLIEIPPIDEDTKRMLSKAGVNWDSVTQAFERVNIWAESVNAQFKIIFEKMPTEKGIADELIKRAEEKQKQFAQQQQQAASSGKEGGGGIGMGDIIKVVDKVMSSESSNPLMNKYMDALITRNMNEMVESTTFDKIMREYFVKKMSKELGEPLMSAGAGAKP